MNLLSITSTILSLKASFNFAGAPGGEPFWNDVIARLTDYREALLEERPHSAAAHPTPVLPKDLFATKDAPPGWHGTHALLAYESLGICFTFENTAERDGYWRAIRQYLMSIPWGYTYKVSFGDAVPNKKAVTSLYTEDNHLAAYGHIIAGFANNLWYKPGMWPHHDPADPCLLRYCPTGKAPIERNLVTTKPGKFLTEHYGDALGPDQIAALAAIFRTVGKPPKLKLARTAEEITAVYRHGPGSCMTKAIAIIDGIPSVQAYASPDFAVAYIERNGKPNARCLVLPERKAYGRIYGDHTAMLKALKAEGYINSAYHPKANSNEEYGDRTLFYGARLTALHAKDQRPAKLSQEESGEPVLITPYFDGKVAAYFNREDGYLHLADASKPDPKSGPKHGLLGGYSLMAIPKDKMPYHANGEHLSCTIGAGGTNGQSYVKAEELGRPCLIKPKPNPKPITTIHYAPEPAWYFEGDANA